MLEFGAFPPKLIQTPHGSCRYIQVYGADSDGGGDGLILLPLVLTANEASVTVGQGKLHGLWGEGSELANWVWCLPRAPALDFGSFLPVYVIYHKLSCSETSDFLRGM